MPWQDRIQPGAFRSPKGTRIPYRFKDLKMVRTARGKVFEFSGFKGGYVQRRKRGPDVYPMAIFFDGPEHDLIAKAFMAAVDEDGVGTLEHPFYGTKKVIPLGEITRNDRLKTAANQTVFEVTFIETIESIFPLRRQNPEASAAALLAAYNAASAGRFAGMNLRTQLSRANLIAKINQALDKIEGALGKVSDSVGKARAFSEAVKTLNRTLDVLVGQPLALAGQIQRAILEPALVLGALKARLEGYAAALAEMFDLSLASSADSSSVDSIRTRAINDFETADLCAGGATSGAIQSVLNTSFSNRPEAVEAALTVLELLEDLQDWRDERFNDLGINDPGESIQLLTEAANVTAAAVVQISFSLRPERGLVLDRARTIVDLSAELYQSTSNETLDRLIRENKLVGSEILELPPGRKIVYYP